MIGPNLVNYLYNNYSYYICTPLSKQMYAIISFIWENKNPELMSKLNVNQKHLIILIIYGPDFEELFEKINFSNNTEKKELYQFLIESRNEFKLNHGTLHHNHLYDNELFNYILKHIVKLNIKNQLDELEKELIKYDEMLKKSKLNNDIIYIFYHYYDYIIKKMIELEQYIDDQKVIYIKSYREMIYDVKHNKQELKNFFEDKIYLFQNKIQKELTIINQKYNVYINLLKRWIPISNNDEKVFKIYHSVDVIEEINIFQDICSLGDLYLIELCSPIINKLSLNEQKNIVQKMSSGVKNRTNHLFTINKSFENFINEVVKDERVTHLQYNLNLNNKDIFQKQISSISNVMVDVLEKYK